MNILELHYMGGLLFMSILSFLFLIVLVLTGWKTYQLFSVIPVSDQGRKRGIPEILEVGTFALFVGILGQIVGLFDAFRAMEGMESIPLPLLAGGLKVSTITTLWGSIIFGISGIFWFLLKQRYLALINPASE
ncbi:MAG: MotA/TolQ/ExbB proton channel family protein [Cyclobacteriaceae bacterium]|nr:MotA/TolQ/ExbB proton channel family protein [Cyclobacteriaceae bacterium]